MELSMSGGALRTFTRCVTCLARVGSDLVLRRPAQALLRPRRSSAASSSSPSSARPPPRSTASLPRPDAPKLQLTLHCLNGVRKTYWIACSAEREVQTLAFGRGRSRDLACLFSDFQSSLQELTVIATEPAAGAGLPDASDDVGGKPVELRSYIDPTKEIVSDNPHSQHHPSNWVCADEDADDDEDEELFVQTKPHHMD